MVWIQTKMEKEISDNIILLEVSGVSLKTLREATKKGDFSELNKLLDPSR